jgi:hypothetical protein
MSVAKTDNLSWRIEDIDFDSVDTRHVDYGEPLVLLLAGSSFVEAASHVYTRNLVEHFAGDAEVSDWLVQYWEPQELQHGRALRSYVAKIWPDFDWERGYERFLRDYSRLCSQEELETVRGLELVARCVVETGTATLYRAIHGLARDPVLRLIATNISSDETRHYKYFYRYFKKYQAKQHNARTAILGALVRRTVKLRQEDADYGLRHAFLERYRERAFDAAMLHEKKSQITAMVRRNYPFDMGYKMLLKPLALPAVVRACVRYPVVLAARRFVLG